MEKVRSELRDALAKSRSPAAEGEHAARWPHLQGLTDTVERGVHLLDNALRIPGTRLRFGLDPIVGLVVPGGGDVLGGAVSLCMLFLAVQYRVPVSVLASMVLNIAVDAAVGAVPVVGDLFDLVWKANDRNFRLLQRHRAERSTRGSVLYWLGVSSLLVLGLACLIAPIVLVIWLVSSFLK
jgi:hypothetical protein